MQPIFVPRDRGMDRDTLVCHRSSTAVIVPLAELRTPSVFTPHLPFVAVGNNQITNDGIISGAKAPASHFPTARFLASENYN